MPALPSGVAELTMAMLAKEPAGRPTMGEAAGMIRQLRGLPPQKQTGTYNVAAATPSLSTTQDAPADPAAVVPANVQAPMLTPRGEKALGELSPRSLIVVPPVSAVPAASAVPISIGSQPSIPVTVDAAPTQGVVPLAATPEASTSPGAPEALQAAIVSPPSAPTLPQSGGRRRYWLGAVLVLGVVISAGATIGLW